jgi:hypothetical protein
MVVGSEAGLGGLQPCPEQHSEEVARLIGISNQIKLLVKREPAELLSEITESGKILGSRSDAVNWLGTLTPLKGSTRI